MDLEIVKQKAAPILQKYGIATAAVFGSYARGEETSESDIDILIEYAPGAKKSLFIRARLRNELSEALQKDVDLVTINALSPFLREDVLREKMVIL